MPTPSRFFETPRGSRRTSAARGRRGGAPPTTRRCSCATAPTTPGCGGSWRRGLPIRLRYESPEQRTTFRTVVEPVTIGGHALAPGDQIGVIIGAANRDDAVFPDADRFDVTRDPNPHLAFGSGGHVCLGKGLARLEARLAIAALVAAFPRLELAAAEPAWRRDSFFRALERLPARPGPRA